MGCDGVQDSTPGAGSSARQTGFGGVTVEPDPISLLGLDVEVSGSFVPGGAVRVASSVTAPEMSVPFTLTVSSPELERLRDGAYFTKDGVGSVVRANSRRAPVASEARTLGQGGTTSHEATLEFPEPGLYTIEVSAHAELTADQLPSSMEYADGTRQTLWVLIGEGGRLLDRPDIGALPDGYVKALGPLRTPDEAPAFAPETPVAGKSGSQTMRVVYDEYITNDTDVPLQGARVVTASTSGQTLLEAVTDANGEAPFLCPADVGGSVIVSVFTDNVGKIEVHYDPAEWIPYNESAEVVRIVNPACASRTEQAVTSMANTLAAMNRIEAVYAAAFGRSRGPVDVYLTGGNEGPVYSYNNISMGDDNLDSHYGFYSWAHEYGHAFQHRALGGYPRGECIGGHFFDGAENFGCAYAEGFANFVSAFAIAELYPSLYQRQAQNSYHYLRVVRNGGYPGLPAHSNRPDYIHDGSIIEGPVSSFLWDLYDAPGTPNEFHADEADFDLTNYPLSYIGDVIRTCKWVDGSQRNEEGIDHLISCFENRRVPYSNQFFRLRYEDGVGNYGVLESATEPSDWEPADIRTLWRKVLYGLGPQPITVAVNGPMNLAANETGTWWGGVAGESNDAVYQWETRVHQQGSSNSGGTLEGDHVEIYGLWTQAGNGTSFSKRMYHTAERLDVRLTVSDGGRSGSGVLTVYRADE